jgi:hypothetical protein
MSCVESQPSFVFFVENSAAGNVPDQARLIFGALASHQHIAKWRSIKAALIAIQVALLQDPSLDQALPLFWMA